MESKNIEDRYIPGITAKQLFVFFSGIITVVVSVMATYYSLKADNVNVLNKISLIESNISKLQKDGETRDLRIDGIKVEIQNLNLRMTIMEEEYKGKSK